MAGLLARGSVQLAAFPTCRLGTEISGIGQALTAYSCGGSRGLASKHLAALDAYHIPSSLSRSREAIKGASTTSRPHIVNGNPAFFDPRLWSAAALLSLPTVCITLNALSGARYQLYGVGE